MHKVAALLVLLIGFAVPGAIIWMAIPHGTFHDPSFFAVEWGLLVGPCIVLGALGYRYSHAAAFGIWRVMLCAFLWSLPLTWVLAVVGVGHGGMALFFPAWFALGGSLLADSSGTLVYPSLLLTPLLPIVAFVATAYYMRFRRARRARAERSVVRWRG